MQLPKAKQDNLVQQDLGGELLIYDLETNKACSLNETSAIVFNACNGRTTFAELKAKHKFTDDLIFLTLDELKKESLLADDDYWSPLAGLSRREAARRIGLGTMIALPMIMGVVAPAAAAAQSVSCRTVGQTCTSPNLIRGECCFGNSFCLSGTCSPCVPVGVERCFNLPGFTCQSIADTCCTGKIVSGPAVNSGCIGQPVSCFCVA